MNANAIWLLIKELLTSKKFLVFVSGVIVTFLARYGFNADPLIIQGVIAMVVAYLFGQGIADSGKEAAKVHEVAAAAKDSSATPAKRVEIIKNA